MQRTSGRERGEWAALVRGAREAVGLTKAELGRRIGVDRATIARWEAGVTTPEDPAVIARFADLFHLDLDECLAAAGLRPRTKPATKPEPPAPEDIRRLLEIWRDPTTTDATREQILAVLRGLNDLAASRPRRPGRKAG